MSNKIVVVGSCMIDFVTYAPRLPQKGETIHGTKFVTNFGGKGANQCVAAAKLGGTTILIARVGDDLWGDKYIANLKSGNINTNWVKKTPNFSSGVAQITVSEEGDNQIVIVAGANTQLGVEDLSAAEKEIKGAAVLVLQLETSVEVALKALELNTGISILNGAPALENCDSRLFSLPTIFCVNETEAEIFSGVAVKSINDAELAGRELLKKGCNSVVITLGEQGAIHVTKKEPKCIKVSCPKVKCIDSTGAGDGFIGALAFMLATRPQLGMEQILQKSCCIASDSVTKIGTQTSFPGIEILN